MNIWEISHKVTNDDWKTYRIQIQTRVFDTSYKFEHVYKRMLEENVGLECCKELIAINLYSSVCGMDLEPIE